MLKKGFIEIQNCTSCFALPGFIIKIRMPAKSKIDVIIMDFGTKITGEMEAIRSITALNFPNFFSISTAMIDNKLPTMRK